MPLNFEPRLGSAVDLNTGLTIYTPRMLPASLPENPDHTEYQYSIHRNGHRISGLGLFGTDLIMEKAGHRERVFTLDLGRDWVLESVFKFKEMLGNEDDDFVFLQNLARGLVAVYENRSRVAYGLRYVAVTKPSLLAERGISMPAGVELVPAEIAAFTEGDIILAEVFVPARGLLGAS